MRKDSFILCLICLCYNSTNILTHHSIIDIVRTAQIKYQHGHFVIPAHRSSSAVHYLEGAVQHITKGETCIANSIVILMRILVIYGLPVPHPKMTTRPFFK